MEPPNITVTMATELDLKSIFRMRHEVYATELGQHAENDSGRMSELALRYGECVTIEL